MTINKVMKYLESLYPLSKAEKWDNCGLIYGERKKEINKVMVALDLTTEVFNSALEQDVDLIIVHHPFIFDKENPQEELDQNEYKKSLISRLENTGLGLYVMHTNFDQSVNGMKKATASLFSKQETNEKLDYGIILETNIDLLKLKNKIKEKYKINQWITSASDDLRIKKIAILPGSGGLSDILKAKKYNCDIVVTADVKWSTWIFAKEINIPIIQIPHDMEKVMINKVADDLNKVNGLDICVHYERII